MDVREYAWRRPFLRGGRISRALISVSSSSSSSSSSLPSSWRSSLVHGPADGVVTGSSSHAAQAICRKKHARGSHYDGRTFQGLDDRREDFPRIGLGDVGTSPRGLGSADAWINDSRRQRDPKSSTKLPGFADPRTPRIVERRPDRRVLRDFIRLQLICATSTLVSSVTSVGKNNISPA